jgi:hypothetical protein
MVYPVISPKSCDTVCYLNGSVRPNAAIARMAEPTPCAPHATDMARTPPREQRKVTFIKAHLRDEAEWLDVVIGNVSAYGVMVKCRNPPPVGSEVEIGEEGFASLARSHGRRDHGLACGLTSPLISRRCSANLGSASRKSNVSDDATSGTGGRDGIDRD